MKRNYLLTLLCVLVAILLPNEVWAWKYVKIQVYSEPSAGGKVYVSKNDNETVNNPTSSSSANADGSNATSKFTFYGQNFPNDGYIFKGWSTSSTSNTGNSSKVLTITGMPSNNTAFNRYTVTYYAIFARLAANVSELNFNVERPNTLTKEVIISHSHAGKITAALSGDDAGQFSISTNTPVENSVSEGNTTMIVTYNPSCSGSHEATLTISSNNELTPVTITLKGTASLVQGQELLWKEPISTNISVGSTSQIAATSSVGLGVSYTSDNTSVLTVDEKGNITAKAEGTATITASQAGDCTYAAATSITKTFTVNDKSTPTFWLENNQDLIEKNLMVDGTTTINITNIDAAGFTPTYDANLLDFSLVDGVATITAKNAGTATLTLTQTATDAVVAASRTFTFNIIKHIGTLTLTDKLGTAYKVDDAANVVDCYMASNSEVEVQVESSNTDVIAVVEGQLKAVGVGTATVTFKQAETYKWTELSASREITVSKYDLSASISQSAATWDATISHPFAISYDLNDYAVEALDPAIATYTDGAIQTYAETGTARFVLSRLEDYKYNQLAETLSISVAPAQESCVLYSDNTEYSGNHEYVLSAAGAELSIQIKHQTAAVNGNVYLKGYTDAGVEVETILALSTNDDLSSSYQTFTRKISPLTRKIQFTKDGGSLNRYVRNMSVTRAPYFSPSEVNKTIESTIGTDAKGTIQVQYNSCGATVKVVSDNPKITVSPTSFYAEGSGTQEIVLTGDATVLGTETATITIYDQSKKTTVNVTSTITRIPQTIAWQSSFENLDVFSTVRLGATALGLTEVVYSIAEGEQEKASIEGNVLSFKEAGTVHVVATAAQSEIYEGVSDTVSVVVSLAQPVVSVFPTVEAVTYGTALTNAMLQGGVAKYGETTVEGSFAWADEQITEGLKPNTYSFNVRFTPADATHYSTAVCTVGVTVNKAQQTISWQSSFENLDVFSTVRLGATASGLTEVVYSIAEGEQEKASIAGNVLSFNKAGTVHVVATAAQSEIYEGVSDTVSVVVSLAQPVVSVFPTVEAVTYGTALTNAMLQGGVAKYGETTVEGSFAWADEKITEGLKPNTYSFNVRFTPADATHYSTAVCTVGVTVNKAQQTIAWQSSFENLDVFNTVTLDARASGATDVVYSIAEGEQGKASIEGNMLSFKEAGVVHVVATAAQSDIYESVSDTVSVEVRLAQPVVSVFPTVEAVVYGTALTDAMLQGGVAKYGETTVEGSFAWADEQITDGLTPNTYSFNVRFTPANAKHYSTADCSVGVTVNKAQQTIAWQSSFENLDVFNTVTLDARASGATDVVYSIAEGEQGKASIEGNVLSFNEAGTVHVVATAAQSDIYEGVSDTVSVEVHLAQPVVSVFPTVEAVVYGTALTDAMLQGGVAKYGETTVEGSFAWADEQITDGLTPNTYSFNVRFTPANAKHYSTADCSVGVTVNKAKQTIAWQSSFENLNVQSKVILSATAQTTVRFAVSDTAVATIIGDRLRFLKAGTIDVVAIAEGSDLYEEVADTIKGVVIARIDPVVSQWPVATLTYGKTLTDVMLSGKSDIEGTFQWGESVTEADLAAVKTAETYTYDVKFVPTEGGLFNTLYGKATITIVEATQKISWENAPTACKVGERIALEAVASSGLAVEYYVEQMGNYAMIDTERNELVALAKGAIQLRVRQAGEAGKYAAAEDLVLTINIEAGITTATEQVSANEQVMVRKVMRDGVLYILRGGMCYDINGRLIGAE